MDEELVLGVVRITTHIKGMKIKDVSLDNLAKMTGLKFNI